MHVKDSAAYFLVPKFKHIDSKLGQAINVRSEDILQWNQTMVVLLLLFACSLPLRLIPNV